MTAEAAPQVTVRARWNAAEAARVAVAALWDLHVRDQAGGVCRASSRAFLSAHVWCDAVPAGALGHRCAADTAPHDLLVCILPNDNPAPVYSQLGARARR